LIGHAPAPGLRAAGPDDEPFLRRLYGDVRAAEFAALGLNPAALASLLEMQFTAQDRAYRQRHPDAEFSVVLVDGAPAGRLSVDRGGESIHVIDIALLTEHRGHGHGTALLGALLEEARRDARPVVLEAVRTSTALPLYDRLGFTASGGDEVYVQLTWRPPRDSAS
jgi:GNAT superfamily N-acetyltransferase